MSLRRVALVASVVASLSTSCSPAPVTQLVVAVRVDTVIPGEISALDVLVTTPGDGTHHAMTALTGSADSLQTIGIRYVSGALGPIRIRATGTGTETIVQTRTTEFVRGESRIVTLVLTHACAAVTCDEGTTCEFGRCVDAHVAGTSLPTWQGTLPEAMDANVTRADAPNFDATTDAQLGTDAVVAADAPDCTGDPLVAQIGSACTPAEACQVGIYTCVANSVQCVGATDGGTPVPQTAGHVCRAAGGVCDVAEACDGRSVACPADGFEVAGRVCADGVCDGVGGCGSCPAGMPCTAPGNPCQVGVYDCRTAVPVCARLVPAEPTTTCRAATGPCDVPERCDLVGRCPTDSFAAPSVVCRLAAGGGSLGPSCDVAELCDGVSGACPADRYAASGTTCRVAMGPCDAPESCIGTSASCPPMTVNACDAGTDAFRPDAFSSPDAFVPRDAGSDAPAIVDAGRDASVPI